MADDHGAVAGTGYATTVNHAWVTGLRPDTRHHHRVTVDGSEVD
ncbi:hypothetical protein ACVGOW_22345 [Pseudonocardia saturnea]